MNPIEAAVLPLKQAAIDRAEEAAYAHADKIGEEISKAGNDLQICTPYPNSIKTPGRIPYMIAYEKYRLYRKLTTLRPAPARHMDSPEYADIDPAKVDQWVKEAKEAAALSYDKFVAKLNKKIGPVREATLTGNHVWGYSHLTVVTEAGEKQIWRTQIIVNVSCLGKIFNQWPTRRVKSEEAR